jgi:hypothetical protein
MPGLPLSTVARLKVFPLLWSAEGRFQDQRFRCLDEKFKGFHTALANDLNSGYGDSFRTMF